MNSGLMGHLFHMQTNNNYFFLFEFSTVCPYGVISITGTTGFIGYPSSGDYGVNEIKCWKFKVPDPYVQIAYVFP